MTMPRRYHSSAARCPSYRGEEWGDKAGGIRLFCAGVGGAETLRLYFRDGQKAVKHRDTYCRDCWRECPVAVGIAYEACIRKQKEGRG